jgi:hypothetical protein
MKAGARAIIFLLLAALPFSGCSMLTAQGRRERAYAHYVAKSSKGRVKQQRRLSSLRSRIPELFPRPPVVTTGVSGPESVTSGEGGE